MLCMLRSRRQSADLELGLGGSGKQLQQHVAWQPSLLPQVTPSRQAGAAQQVPGTALTSALSKLRRGTVPAVAAQAPAASCAQVADDNSSQHAAVDAALARMEESGRALLALARQVGDGSGSLRSRFGGA